MSTRRRVEAIERRVGPAEEVVVSIILDGSNDACWQERAEWARRRGYRLRVTRFVTEAEADTLEEAEALIATHRERGTRMPITVRRSDGGTWTTWDPGLPEWIRGDTEAGPAS